MENPRTALDRALSYLASAQGPDGGFRTEVSRAPRLAGARAIESPYLHGLVQDALVATLARAPGAEALVRTADGYLVRTHEATGWWRFFGPGFPDRLPDLDTTSVGYAARILANPGDAALVARAHRWLDSLEPVRSECGLFKTWQDPAINAHDFELPDAMVNANVLFLQGLLGRPDPRLVAFFHLIVTRSSYHVLNLWGSARFAVPWLIARAFRRGGVAQLGDRMDLVAALFLRTQRADGGWGTDLDTALAAVSLLNAGHDGPEAARGAAWLTARQQPDGGWTAGTLFRDMLPEFYGARVFTTALAAELLARLSGSPAA